MSSLYPDLPGTSFPSDGIDTFVTFLNMLATDGTLVNQYQTAMKAGDLATAQAILAQIPNANQKVLTADKLNKYKDAIVALERFWLADIEPYVGGKQVEWENIIDRFSYLGEYNPATQYQKNNMVEYLTGGVNLTYIAILQPPIGTSPTNTTYWRQITIQGVKGDSGTGMAFMFAWSASQPYVLNNVVTYDNALWGCKIANTNQPPFVGSTYWEYIFDIKSAIYPVQQAEPTGLSVGELWFRVLI